MLLGTVQRSQHWASTEMICYTDIFREGGTFCPETEPVSHTTNLAGLGHWQVRVGHVGPPRGNHTPRQYGSGSTLARNGALAAGGVLAQEGGAGGRGRASLPHPCALPWPAPLCLAPALPHCARAAGVLRARLIHVPPVRHSKWLRHADGWRVCVARGPVALRGRARRGAARGLCAAHCGRCCC